MQDWLNRLQNTLALGGLTTQVLLFAVFPISLVLIAITFGSLSLHRQAMRSLVGERDERTVLGAANALGEQLSHRVTSIQGLAVRLGDDVPGDQILATAGYLLPDFDLGLAIYSPEGLRISNVGDDSEWDSLEPKLIPVILSVLTSNGEGYYFTTLAGEPTLEDSAVFVFSQAGARSPIVVGGFSITRLARQILAGTTVYGDETAIVLLDNSKQILFSQGGYLEDASNHPGVQEALRGETGTTFVVMGDVEHVVAFTSVPPLGWALIMEEPWDSVTSPMLRYSEAGPLVLIPILLFALGALFLSARQIIQPLKALEISSAALEWGDFHSVRNPVGGIQEIKNLQRTLIHMAERTQRAQQGLRNYIGIITDTQEAERKRLARELHDDSLQSLIAINQRLQMAKRKVTDPELETIISETEQMLMASMQGLRRFTGSLRPLYLEDLGLVASLEMLAREATETHNLHVHFHHAGLEKRLPDEIEIGIYRIAQEALKNAGRHASASLINMSLVHQEHQIILAVADNGTGFVVPESPSDLAPEGHYGLLGIYERAELMGAQFEIHSEPGNGVELKVIIPSEL